VRATNGLRASVCDRSDGEFFLECKNIRRIDSPSYFLAGGGQGAATRLSSQRRTFAISVTKPQCLAR